MINKNFYDTCTLLNHYNRINFSEKFYISEVTLEELENIKTSFKKSNDLKYNARKVLNLLCDASNMEVIRKFHPFVINNDKKILLDASSIKEEICFITDDLNCYLLAKEKYELKAFLGKNFFNTKLENSYTGYKEVSLSDANLAIFYGEDLPKNKNTFKLLTNEYLLIKEKNKIIDEYIWTGERYVKVPYRTFQSSMFGDIKPFKEDAYQKVAMDALVRNKITVISGPAGTGKSLLSFGYMFSLLDKGEIDKIIIFCNTVATKGAAKLGFYPGSRTEKLLDSQIGNFLTSKLGHRMAVEKMIDDGQLILLPMSDLRGFDTSGMNAAIYITEAQNLDIELMRLALQRIGEDSICIIDGDARSQVDLDAYAGTNNGMNRLSEVFRGDDCYGEVVLKNIHRSHIAELAQKM
jgi:predicted ribonuclease YlaK